jgi:hypothetical protein
VRDDDMGWGWAGSGSTTGTAETSELPQIIFGAGSPEEDDVISGTAIPVYAEAIHPMTNGLLTNMFFYVDTQPLRNTSDDMAQFTINAQTGNRFFNWDTTAALDDGTPISPDGIRTLKIEVWDNIGQQDYKIRRVYVDNDRPPDPGGVWVEWKTDNTLAVAWDQVMDGTSPVYSYFVGVDEDYGTGLWEHTHWRCGDGVQDLRYEIPVTDPSLAYDPFRRFRIRHYSQSPSTGMSWYAITGPFVTPPTLSGYSDTTLTKKNKNFWNYTVRTGLQWTGPQFPISAVEYTVWRSESSDMSGRQIAFSTTDPDLTDCEDEVTGTSRGNAADEYYYQLEASFVASGPDATGAWESVWSNVAGPTGYQSGYLELNETW